MLHPPFAPVSVDIERRLCHVFPFFSENSYNGMFIIVIIMTIVKYRLKKYHIVHRFHFFQNFPLVNAMIVYTPFWETLRRSGESTYTLTHKYNISSATIDRIRHNRGISTLKINDLCRILHCRVEDILLYVESESDQLP